MMMLNDAIYSCFVPVTRICYSGVCRVYYSA